MCLLGGPKGYTVGAPGAFGPFVAEEGRTRDYVYVEDVALANVVALENEIPSGAYNIGTGLETSVNRLYELLLENSAKNLPPQHGPAKPGEQLRSSVDPSLAERVLGWRPEVRLPVGLRETYRFFAAAK